MKMKVNKIINKLLTNKYILYIVLFLAITNVLGYLMVKDFESIALFIALGVISSYFSKNMIIVLSIAMLGTNFVFANNKIREGMTEGHASNHHPHKKKKRKKKKKQAKEEGGEEAGADGEGSTNLTPAPVKSSKKSEEADDDESPGGRIDYAATMEQAYDNLSSLIGKGGISNLSNETKSLLNQQKQLAGQLESMGPLLKDAKSLINGLKLPKMDELENIMGKFGGLGNLTKK
jgi:hypothetical protein